MANNNIIVRVVLGQRIGADGISPTVDVVESGDEVRLRITDATGARETPNLKGRDGEPGAPGADGKGLPAGGSKGQYLEKQSSADYDYEWVDVPAPEYAQETGDAEDTAMSQAAVTRELNSINGILNEQYSKIASFTASPSVVEKGIGAQSIKLSWRTTFNDQTITPDSLSVKKSTSGTPLTTDTSLKTIQDTAGITETTTYSIEATIKGIKKTASATVNAYYPMYFGGSASEEITSEELLALTKQSIKSSPAGQVTIPLTTGQYLWLCVPEGMSINGVGILNSSPVGLIAPVTVSVPNKGNYRCYRSDSAMIRDTNDTYIIN